MQISELNIFISIIGVVFVFLFAIEKFTHQIQRLAGDRFKRALGHFTATPIRGVIMGTGLTSIIQSSTAVIVMLVSLVDAGLLSFGSSLGIIIGANIGTTITTQLVAFKILNIAPYILILGFFLMKIRGRYQNLGKPIFYFGLIFSSLFLMSVLVTPLQNSASVINLISYTSNLFTAILIGFIISNIFQSSSVTTSIVVIFAASGLLSFEQSIGIILGANIGTTTTALVASLVVGKSGKRVAVAHFLFNFIGTLLFIPIIGPFIRIITNLNISTAQHVAIGHLAFNLIIAIIFIIFIKPFENLVTRIIK